LFAHFNSSEIGQSGTFPPKEHVRVGNVKNGKKKSYEETVFQTNEQVRTKAQSKSSRESRPFQNNRQHPGYHSLFKNFHFSSGQRLLMADLVSHEMGFRVWCGKSPTGVGVLCVCMDPGVG
jgi:hypothetical protein